LNSGDLVAPAEMVKKQKMEPFYPSHKPPKGATGHKLLVYFGFYIMTVKIYIVPNAIDLGITIN
jgi:hypothetical protein